MSIVDAQIRTISCNSCDKTVTFNMAEHAKIVADPENVWLRSSRVIQRGDGRNFVYCSDECEIKGIEKGEHNIPEEKKIVEAPNAEAIRVAAEAAKAAEEGTKALKSGKSTKLQVVR